MMRPHHGYNGNIYLGEMSVQISIQNAGEMYCLWNVVVLNVLSSVLAYNQRERKLAKKKKKDG